MLARLGNVLYWAACLLTLVPLLAFGWMAFDNGGIVPFVIGILIAGLIWLVGRACRYVLAGT